ncbi:MAG: Rne/Rng family ribonuclease [Bacteroidia bacterium]
MSSELIINCHPSGGIEIALMRDKKLIELHHERADQNFAVGDVYFGSVNKLMPGLNAAFVDVGHERDAFLHYLDLGPQVKSLIKFTKMLRSNPQQSVWPPKDINEPDIEKTGKVGKLLSRFQQVIVQVTKEPISNKGPRLTSQLSLAGRFLVLMPFDEGVSVSKKIVKQDERLRLKKLVQSIKPNNFGVIVRTVAEEQSVEDLHKDLKELMNKWEHLCEQVKTAEPKQKILGEGDRSLTLVRDLLNDDFTGIHVNDQYIYKETKNYVKSKAPDLEKIVKYYNGKNSIFENFGVDKQIKAAFGKEVNFLGGCYLIIEHTEALHVIDVNSGSTAGKEINQEENSLKVNMEAATEIARQLRLRDMGGIVVIDFIDQKSPGNRRKVYEKLKDEMSTDRAKHKILPMSPFGLVQITRQRVRPQMNIVVNEKCPTCKGTGETSSSVVLMDEIENRLKYLMNNFNIHGISLHVHPYIGAFLTKGYLRSKRMSWFFKYWRLIKIKVEKNYQFGEYKFFNSAGEEINV